MSSACEFFGHIFVTLFMLGFLLVLTGGMAISYLVAPITVGTLVLSALCYGIARLTEKVNDGAGDSN